MESPTEKSFPLHVVMSLTTGCLLRNASFADMVKLGEHLTGQALVDAAFHRRTFVDQLRAVVEAQHPGICAEAPPKTSLRGEAFHKHSEAWFNEMQAKYGDPISIRGKVC